MPKWSIKPQKTRPRVRREQKENVVPTLQIIWVSGRVDDHICD